MLTFFVFFSLAKKKRKRKEAYVPNCRILKRKCYCYRKSMYSKVVCVCVCVCVCGSLWLILCNKHRPPLLSVLNVKSFVVGGGSWKLIKTSIWKVDGMKTSCFLILPLSFVCCSVLLVQQIMLGRTMGVGLGPSGEELNRGVIVPALADAHVGWFNYLPFSPFPPLS